MFDESKLFCPYCGVKMSKWEGVATYSWGGGSQYICFNDDCEYYIRGWDHTFNCMGIKASYRHRFDPNTGQTGPFPVNSETVGKDGIVS